MIDDEDDERHDVANPETFASSSNDWIEKQDEGTVNDDDADQE